MKILNPIELSSIIIGVVLLMPILISLFLSTFKPTIKKQSYIYLYSLSAGFILVLGLFGLIAEPLIGLRNTYSTLTVIGLGVGGTILGMGGSFIIRHIISFKIGEIHKNHKEHNHGDFMLNLKEVDNKKSKFTIIFLLMTHKIPAGLTLGLMIFSIKNHSLSYTTLIAYIIHIIPEILIVYYRQIEMGTNKWKATIITGLIQLMLIPTILLGAFVNFDFAKWVIPFIFVMSGSVLVFASIIELVPEFMDIEITHKRWHKTIILFVIGFIIALTILMIHKH